MDDAHFQAFAERAGRTGVWGELRVLAQTVADLCTVAEGQEALEDMVEPRTERLIRHGVAAMVTVVRVGFQRGVHVHEGE